MASSKDLCILFWCVGEAGFIGAVVVHHIEFALGCIGSARGWLASDDSCEGYLRIVRVIAGLTVLRGLCEAAPAARCSRRDFTVSRRTLARLWGSRHTEEPGRYGFPSHL